MNHADYVCRGVFPSSTPDGKLVPQIFLMSSVAIGLWKPYAKTEVNVSRTVGCLLTQDGDDNSYLTGSKYLE
jgi:hypothetical protein